MKAVKTFALLALCALAQSAPLLAEEGEKKEITWSINGEARFRPEWRDDLDLDETVADDTRRGFMRLRLGFTILVRDDYRVFVQAQDSRIAGEEPSTATDRKNLDLHQGYLDWKKMGVKGLSLTLGRQEWSYGEDRLIGNFAWDNIGRAFDGAKIAWGRERFWIHGLIAQISNVNVAAATEGSDLYGTIAHWGAREKGEYEGYWLGFSDRVAAAGETGAFGETAINAFGGRMKDWFGPFDFNAEAVMEKGEFRGDDLDAMALAFQGGMTWGEAVKVRAFAGYDLATGDEDSTDGKREEFFNFFPTNHIHYGYADLFGWRNLESPYAGVSVATKRHFYRIKAHAFDLENAKGPWKDAGGAVLGFDATGGSGTDVGTEVDLTYRFTFKEKATIEAGFSRFTPGDFAKATRGPDPSDWAYVMMTFGF